MRRIACSLGWAVVLYLVGCKVIGAAAGTWEAANYPEEEATVAVEAAAAAIEAGRWYVVFSVACLVGLATYFGVLPGTEAMALPLVQGAAAGLDPWHLRLNRRLAGIVVGLLVSFLLAATALHLLRPEYDPRSRFLSEYAIGPYGNLMTAGLAISGTSAIVLALALHRSVTRSFWLALGSTSLALAGIGYVLCAVFPTDLYAPGGGPYRQRTMAGVLHDNLATASAVFATLTIVLLPIVCRRCARWRPFVRPAIFAACATAIAFLIGAQAPREYAGLAQRFWVTTSALCFLLIALRLRAVHRESVAEDDSVGSESALV